MIALPVLSIVAGMLLRWAFGGSAVTGAIGLVLIGLGTVWLAAMVVTGRWWQRREQSLPDSSRTRTETRA
ncbi:MAG: hypothetical protein ABI658_19395 [Acidimicrobiales bacterium]